jgi:uncharacterized membrane protein
MSRFIAEIISIVIAAVTSAVVVISLQRQSRLKHRLRATIGLMLAVLAACIIVSRLILGRLDSSTLIVDLPVVVVGAVLFWNSVYWRKQRADD